MDALQADLGSHLRALRNDGYRLAVLVRGGEIEGVLALLAGVTDDVADVDGEGGGAESGHRTIVPSLPRGTVG